MKSSGLKNRVTLFVSGTDDQLQDVPILWSYRSIVLMSIIQSCGGGNKLMSEGCHEDGLIEVFFISSLAKMVGAALTPFKCEVVARAKRIVLKTVCPSLCFGIILF